MRYRFLVWVFLLITTIGYSQRNFTIGVKFNSENVKIKDFTTTFNYSFVGNQSFLIKVEDKTYYYVIDKEVKGATRGGQKFTTYHLIPDDTDDKAKSIQVFENKEYGIRLFMDNEPCYYQLYD